MQGGKSRAGPLPREEGTVQARVRPEGGDVEDDKGRREREIETASEVPLKEERPDPTESLPVWNSEQHCQREVIYFKKKKEKRINGYSGVGGALFQNGSRLIY